MAWPSDTSPLDAGNASASNINADADPVTGSGGGRDQLFVLAQKVNEMLASMDAGATPYTDSNPQPFNSYAGRINTGGTVSGQPWTAVWSGTNTGQCTVTHTLNTTSLSVVATANINWNSNFFGAYTRIVDANTFEVTTKWLTDNGVTDFETAFYFNVSTYV